MSPPSPKINAVRIIGLVVVIQAVLVSLFAWSAGTASLREMTKLRKFLVASGDPGQLV